MKILVVAYNLFKNVGGGETVYQRIINSLKDFDFTYLTDDMSNEGAHPANAHPVLVPPGKTVYVEGNPGFPQYILGQLREADRVAQAVAGQEFDIVDIPDYMTYGAYLRSAFAHHKVKVGRIILAMHGNISTSISLNWDTIGKDVSDLAENEARQFRCADSVYAISKSYIDEWTARITRSVQYVDPMCFITHGNVECWQPGTNEKVTLACIGRSERLKGNDLFVDMNRWIDHKYIECGVHIGGIYRMENGDSSDYHLANLAGNRSIQVPYLGSKNRQELNELFQQRVIVVLPVRYDTLNLVVLEALFSGCPVAVSTNAGVCRYLDETFPQLPYIKLNLNNYADAISKIEAVAADYDAYRQKLKNALCSISENWNAEKEMRRVYQTALESEISLATVMLQYQYQKTTCKEVAIAFCHRLGLGKIARALQPARLIRKGKEKMRKHAGVIAMRWLTEIKKAKFVSEKYWNISGAAENTAPTIYSKIHEVEAIYDCAFYHCYAYHELSRLLKKVGNQDLCITYALRIMRLAGRDLYGQLAEVVQALQQRGNKIQASLAQLMYNGSTNSADLVYQWLQQSYEKWKVNPTVDACAIVEDSRHTHIPKVSVIVSLYNAADKLDFFLSMISKQTLAARNEVEFIFVDSCSPMDEHSILEKYKGSMNMLYLRSFRRETIQKAWNRAIPYARADYITFLGVDEMMYPEALECLSKELDHDPSVDWVVGNSLIEAVEMNGTLNRDVMLYDRSGGIRFSSCLETCYLTYVGGLYRKNIHQRFGYYNEEYRGAGDTEFKNRILKHIHVKYLNRTLGIFLDYPQERVTASSMAEIEDLSAWYAYRTPGGIRYQFELAEIAEIESVLRWAVCYRKSFRRDTGSDIEYACYLAEYLLEREPENALARALRPGLRRLLDDLVELDATTQLSIQKDSSQRRFHQIKSDFEQITKEHRNILKNENILYTFYGDNRFQQHRWLWQSEPLRN